MTQLPATSGTPPTEAACSSVRRGGPLGLCPLSVQLRCPSHADLPRAPLSALTGPGLTGTPAEALLPRAEVTSQGSRGWTRSGVLPALPHSSSTLLCPAWVPGAGLSGFANGSPAPQRPLASAGRKCTVWRCRCRTGRLEYSVPCLASELPSGQGPHLPLTWGGTSFPQGGMPGASRPPLSRQLSASAGVRPPCSGNSADTILLANITRGVPTMCQGPSRALGAMDTTRL